MIPMPIIDSGHIVSMQACGLTYRWDHVQMHVGSFTVAAGNTILFRTTTDKPTALERMNIARDAHHNFILEKNL